MDKQLPRHTVALPSQPQCRENTMLFFSPYSSQYLKSIVTKYLKLSFCLAARMKAVSLAAYLPLQMVRKTLWSESWVLIISSTSLFLPIISF